MFFLCKHVWIWINESFICKTISLYLLHNINNLQTFFPKRTIRATAGGLCGSRLLLISILWRWREQFAFWVIISISVFGFSRCICVLTPLCSTDQCAESLRWVSTGDARGVNFDLHHLFHVGRWRLTWIKLPSWAPVRVSQTLTHIKLTSDEQRQEEQECSSGGGLGSHTGQTGRR